jgi:hypothetical protein
MLVEIQFAQSSESQKAKHLHTRCIQKLTGLYLKLLTECLKPRLSGAPETHVLVNGPHFILRG